MSTDIMHRPSREPHPLCVMIRELRKASGVSLSTFEERHGIGAVVLGSYERGDREPGIHRIDNILNVFGYKLTAVPIGVEDGVAPTMMPTDIIHTLRGIAAQLEEQYAAARIGNPQLKDEPDSELTPAQRDELRHNTQVGFVSE